MSLFREVVYIGRIYNIIRTHIHTHRWSNVALGGGLGLI